LLFFLKAMSAFGLVTGNAINRAVNATMEHQALASAGQWPLHQKNSEFICHSHSIS
jgi:hypothetical protein